jgi:AcrR family transcriptional regulator
MSRKQTDHYECASETQTRSPTRQTYHHGGLRDAILKSARETIEERGHEAVRIRELALKLGVVSSALYRHFPSKGALLVALSDQMHFDLGQEIDERIAPAADAQAALLTAARAFLDFAGRSPALFRLMYDAGIIESQEMASSLPALRGNLRRLVELIRRAYSELDPRGARSRLVCLWATLFGYATIRVRGNLKRRVLGHSEQATENVLLECAALWRLAGR